MGGYWHAIFGPRTVNPDGTVNIRCRNCGRIICRRTNPLFATVSECLICQGYPEEVVLQQYIQLDPTQPPIPRNEVDPIYLYADDPEKLKMERTGTIYNIFRVLGIGKKKEPEPVSQKVARKRQPGNVWERKSKDDEGKL